MKTTKRVLLAGLAGLMALSLCACGGSENSSEDSGQSGYIRNLGGYKFTWGTIWSWAPYPEEGATEYGDLHLERYRQVERDYNCTISFTHLNAISLQDEISQAILSGDKYYDFFELDFARYQTYASNLMPLNEIPGFDVNQEKYNNRVRELMAQDGKTYGLCYDYQRLPVGYLMFYNKTLLDSNQLPDPYDLVKNNTWNFSTFREMCQKLTKSTTGGKVNQWGLTGVDWNAQSVELPFLYANGGDVIKKNDAGKWVFAMQENNAQETLQYLNQLFYVDKSFLGSAETLDTGAKEWYNGNAGFFIGSTDYLYGIAGKDSPLKEGIEWGFVPMPMGPSATDYRQMASDVYGWVMMKNHPEAEKAAVVFNAITDPLYGTPEQDKEEYYSTFRDNILHGSDKMLEMYQLCSDHITVNYGWGMAGQDILATAIYSCTREVEYTPKVAMEAIAGNMDWYIELFFYGASAE